MDPTIALAALCGILAASIPLTAWIVTRSNENRDDNLFSHLERSFTVGGTPKDLYARKIDMEERKLGMAEEAHRQQIELQALRTKQAELRSKFSARSGISNPEQS